MFSLGGATTLFSVLILDKMRSDPSLTLMEALEECKGEVIESGMQMWKNVQNKFLNRVIAGRPKIQSQKLWDGYHIITHIVDGQDYKIIVRPPAHPPSAEERDPFQLGYESIVKPQDFFSDDD